MLCGWTRRVNTGGVLAIESSGPEGDKLGVVSDGHQQLGDRLTVGLGKLDPKETSERRCEVHDRHGPRHPSRSDRWADGHDESLSAVVAAAAVLIASLDCTDLSGGQAHLCAATICRGRAAERASVAP